MLLGIHKTNGITQAANLIEDDLGQFRLKQIASKLAFISPLLLSFLDISVVKELLLNVQVL